MTAQKATPQELDRDSRNVRFKDRFRTVFWTSMIVATVVHFGAFAYWPELEAEDFSFTSEELTAVELPPEIEIPPPPRAIARPATPVIASTEVSEEITIAPTTFEENPVESLPPPPEVSEEDSDISEAPTFTPFTVAPEILNREEIIDEMAKAQATQVNQSSGYTALDDAALRVADLYRFSPALNRDSRVPVWVSFPIEFRVIH